MHLPFSGSSVDAQRARSRIIVLWSLVTAAFAATALWGFWERGVYALGMNVVAYLIATIALFLWVMRRNGTDLRANTYWIAPICMIAASFLLYDNPFLKIISILVLPTSFAGFAVLASHTDERSSWSARLLGRVAGRMISAITHAGESFAAHLHLSSFVARDGATAKRVIGGVALFLLLAATVILPLLASADAAFAERVDWLLTFVADFVSAPAVLRIIFTVALSLATVAAVLAWTGTFRHDAGSSKEPQTDSIVAGIILGGTLLLYAFFLAIQVGRLWVGALPFDFSEAVHLVKSGFWQLMALTALNVVLFLFTYRKTTPVVQRVLTAFAAASLLLLASAAQRVWLYVLTYGFSYEKFFASYAVLFCAILFAWLLSRMFAHERADVLRFTALLALWMYAVLTLFPVERFVFGANLALSARQDSRIRMFELTMLSPDALSAAKSAWYAGELAERDGSRPDWTRWVLRQEERIRAKAWYEKNLTNLLYEARPDAYAVTPQRVSLTGYVQDCSQWLPLSVPDTDVAPAPACVVVSGLGYYLLDMPDDASDAVLFPYAHGVRVHVSGTAYPREMMSAEHWITTDRAIVGVLTDITDIAPADQRQ